MSYPENSIGKSVNAMRTNRLSATTAPIIAHRHRPITAVGRYDGFVPEDFIVGVFKP